MKEEIVNILIVDDEPKNRMALQALLESPQYRLLEAPSGEDALRIVLRETIALVLLDVQMPTMNGFEVAKLIKERKKTEDIPIIFISAHFIQETDIFKGYEIGGFDYITKPFPNEVLKSKVSMFVQLYLKNEAIKRYQYYLGKDPKNTLDPNAVAPGVQESTLDQLFPEYQMLILTYVRSMRYQEVLPTEKAKIFIEQLVELHFGSRDLIRLHLKVLKKLEYQLVPMEAQSFSIDARLLLIELMGQLVDHYRQLHKKT